MSYDRQSLFMPLPPAPDTMTAVRWEENARRRRIMEGLWRDDLRQAMAADYSPKRRRRLGLPQTTKNMLRSTVARITKLLNKPPSVLHDDDEAAVRLATLLSDGGYWQVCRRNLRLLVAIRDAALRFNVLQPDARYGRDEMALQARVVPVDHLCAEGDDDAPDLPHTVREYRQRKLRGDWVWTVDRLSVENRGNPTYTVSQPGVPTKDDPMPDDRDISEILIPSGAPTPQSFSGDSYPYRRQDGTPVLPYVVYHMERGKMWSSFDEIELVDGALTCASMMTQWRSVFKDASNPQRATNDMILGAAAPDAAGDATVEGDETSILNFRSDGKNPMQWQWEAGGDAERLFAAILQLAESLASDLDIGGVTPIRRHVDQRSGYALEIDDSSQREIQRALAEVIRPWDEMALRTAAVVWNSAHRGVAGYVPLPETGWGLAYHGVPLTMQERQLRIEEFKMRAELGITSLVTLTAELDGLTEEQAIKRLREWRRHTLEFPLPT